MLVIILAILLMRISFVQDFPSARMDYTFYLQELNPVPVAIGYNETSMSTMNTVLTSKYGSQFEVT
jgi:hypothetical protein